MPSQQQPSQLLPAKETMQCVCVCVYILYIIYICKGKPLLPVPTRKRCLTNDMGKLSKNFSLSKTASLQLPPKLVKTTGRSMLITALLILSAEEDPRHQLH